ncbi:hypothetical protein [Gemmatimonas sp.]|uniref:hypothetical protein n=1 Tax=Gemmatimonas sp. TaxID=1962908 RepID=UPI00262C3AD5|nr:hypothetical protein [Gemmatimonas sp.]
MIRRSGCFLFMLALHACTGTAERSDTGKTARDSAGVSIVEHSAAYMAALPEWTLDSTPLQELRGDATDTQFARILDAVQRADGGFYVADQQQRDIKAFAASGAFERVLSRPGRGPGEVGYVSRLQMLAGDSLAFVDANNRRVSVFGPNGHFARQVLFPRFEDGSSVRINMQLMDGRLLGSLRQPWVEATENRDSVYRTPFAIVAYRVVPSTGADTGVPPADVDTIAVVPDGEAYRANSTEDGETRADEHPLRFGHNTIVASDGRRTFVATNETAEIVEYGAKGMVRRIRSARTPRPVTDEDRVRLESEVLDAVEKSGRPASAKADVQQMVKGWRYAKSHTLASRLLVGADGGLWVEDAWVLENDPRQFFVYDSTGIALARVVLPPRIHVLRVSTREILGVWRDSDDVPHLRRWSISRQP